MLRMFMDFYDGAHAIVLKGVPFDAIREMPQITKMMRVKEAGRGVAEVQALMEEDSRQLEEVAREYKVAA
jgi:hypothetical protein